MINLTDIRFAIKAGATSFLGARMPARTKRLVCLASLGAHLKGTTTLDDETIAKLNAIMVLGSRDSALKLPVQLSKVIWNGMSQQINIQPETLAQVVQKYSQSIPHWLRYAEDSVIYSDVETLITKFVSNLAR